MNIKTQARFEKIQIESDLSAADIERGQSQLEEIGLTGKKSLALLRKLGEIVRTLGECTAALKLVAFEVKDAPSSCSFELELSLRASNLSTAVTATPI